MASGPFVRVYRSIMDDPQFADVYSDDAALALWLRLLLVADALWPASAPIPRRTTAFKTLCEVGLVIEYGKHRYAIRGLDALRKREADRSRNAAAVRWQNARTAAAMQPDQTRPDETKPVGTDASKKTDHPTTFMGFRPKVPVDKEAERRTIERMKQETDEELYRRHPELRPKPSAGSS